MVRLKEVLNPYKGGKFRVTSRYGVRTLNGVQEFHPGLDLVGESSKELVALCDGTIQQSRIVTNKSDLTWQWGNYVCLKADSGELIYYCHLSQRLVKKGARVKKGDVIGIEGDTGYSFGSHCHLEVRASDNKVTDNINTPKFTNIPNSADIYVVEEVKELSEAEVQRLIDAAIASSRERVWHYWDEIKAEAKWAYKPLMALYNEGYFKGESASNLNLGQTKMECLVVMARALKDAGIITY